MSALITAIRRRPLAGGLEAVGAMVGGRNAGTLVVTEGDGAAVAVALMSERVIGAARAAVASYAGAGELSDLLDTLAALAGELDTLDEAARLDATLPWQDRGRASRFGGESEPDYLRRIEAIAEPIHVKPWSMLQECNNRIYYGNPEGTPSGDGSPFVAAVTAGAAMLMGPDGPAPHAWGTFNGARDRVPCWRALAERLREIARDVDAQALGAEAIETPP